MNRTDEVNKTSIIQQSGIQKRFNDLETEENSK